MSCGRHCGWTVVPPGRHWGAAAAVWAVMAVLTASNIETAERDVMACHCLYGDNKWFHLISKLLVHVDANFTAELAQPSYLGSTPAKDFVMERSCDPDAYLFPDSNIIFDTDALDRVGGAGLLQGSPRLELYGFCIPANTILSLLCTQQMLVRRQLKSALKWVQATQHLLSFVQTCMDAHTPFPIVVADVLAYIDWWLRLPGKAPQNWQHFLQQGALFQGVARIKASDPLSTCIPLRDSTCFPEGTQNLYEGCQECCNPELGPSGNAQCWVAGFNYERCCNPSPLPAAAIATAQCANADELNQKLAKSLKAEEDRANEAIRSVTLLKFDLAEAEKSLGAARQRAETLEADAKIAAQKLMELEANVTNLTMGLETEGHRSRQCHADLLSKSEALALEQKRSRSLTADLQNAGGRCEDRVADLTTEVSALRDRWGEMERRARDLELELEERQSEATSPPSASTPSHSSEAATCDWRFCLFGWCLQLEDCTSWPATSAS